jgi:hypothetical protein
MMADFLVDISRWAEKAGVVIDGAPQAIAEAARERLQELTPVVTGNLRAGWQVAQVGPAELEIINNVVYARRVNNGFVGQDSLGRSYDQAGHHMVEQVIAEMPEIAKNAVDQI